MRDAKQTWTEQQERLLRAAQDIVSLSGHEYGPEGGGDYMVSPEDFESLRDIVKEISDDAVREIEANAERVRQALKLEGGAK